MIKDYNHLPIGKYLDILALRDEKDADLRVVGILADKTEDELLNMPLTQYRALADDAAFLYFTPPTPEVAKAYNLGGYRCRVTDAEHLTTAQYIDLKEYAKQEGDHTIESLSCILVPVGEGIKGYGEGYDILDLQRAIRENLMTPDSAALRNFFTARLWRLMRVSLTSSQKTIAQITDEQTRKELQKRTGEMLMLLSRSGAGCKRSTTWPILRAALGPRSIR